MPTIATTQLHALFVFTIFVVLLFFFVFGKSTVAYKHIKVHTVAYKHGKVHGGL